jgi:hypothetical protein
MFLYSAIAWDAEELMMFKRASTLASEDRHLSGWCEKMGLPSVVQILYSVQALGWSRMSSFLRISTRASGKPLGDVIHHGK